MTNPFENKETSGFPVSVGTGLALESLFTPIQEVIDQEREVNNIPDLSVYELYIFNVATILRNLLASIPAIQLPAIKPKQVIEELTSELNFMSEFFISNNIPIAFYVNKHTYFKTAYKDNLRVAKTDKQLILENLTSNTLTEISKRPDITVFHKDVKYKDIHNALILTHTPVDLLSYSNFSKLDLLESHTGKVKTRKEWNSKYLPVPNKDMSVLPFMEYLLCSVFGDTVMFKPNLTKKRQEVYDSLVKKGVHPLMSELSVGFLLR